ncbi:hypothetical protein [Streptomyces sp. NPDC090798]
MDGSKNSAARSPATTRHLFDTARADAGTEVALGGILHDYQYAA